MTLPSYVKKAHVIRTGLSQTNMKTMRMKPPRALFSLFILLAWHVPLRVDSASFYVDPDWTGAHSGLPSQPWQYLDSTAWNAINNALAGDNVTVYFAALKANGTTQQSAARFIQLRRADPSSHRLTLDGYSQYNTSETSPSWTTNPDADISHAYRNGKVFKSTGDGNAALGWYRVDGNDFVIRNGLVYCCIESHTASPDNEPGVGANWRLYWDQNGSSTTRSRTISHCAASRPPRDVPSTGIIWCGNITTSTIQPRSAQVWS